MVSVRNNPALEGTLEELKESSLEMGLPFDLGIIPHKNAIYAFLPYPIQNPHLWGMEERYLSDLHEEYVEKATGENLDVLRYIAENCGLVECLRSEKPNLEKVKVMVGFYGCCYLFKSKEGKS